MKASNSIKRYDCLVHDHDSITTNGERKEYERKKETKKAQSTRIFALEAANSILHDNVSSIY